MSLTIHNDNPVHFPANSSCFAFDKEVASIFDNMAQRAIPMYAETHRVHASLVSALLGAITQKDPAPFPQIVDIGASTGCFYKTLCAVRGIDPLVGPGNQFKAVAIDSSTDMLDKLRAAMPWVYCQYTDASSVHSTPSAYDVANMGYVLQFIHPTERPGVLRAVYHAMKPGATLFISHKEKAPTYALQEEHDRLYRDFRLRNGYSEEEIDAKTEALKGSMWTSTYAELQSLLFHAGFAEITPTMRWVNFCSYTVTKV